MYLDEKSALARLGNNKKLYIMLLNNFKDDKSYMSLKESFKMGDTKKSVLNAHSIKGVSANLSLLTLYEEASKIEEQLKNNEIDMDAIDALGAVIDATNSEIDKYLAENG